MENKPTEALELIQVLIKETTPIDGHQDPEAVIDCWNELTDLIREWHQSAQQFQTASHLPERFIKPTDEQLVGIAILYNDGKLEQEKLADMTAMAMYIIDRLYENGNILIPSSNEIQTNG